jgi:hypothetical protein
MTRPCGRRSAGVTSCAGSRPTPLAGTPTQAPSRRHRRKSSHTRAHEHTPLPTHSHKRSLIFSLPLSRTCLPSLSVLVTLSFRLVPSPWLSCWTGVTQAHVHGAGESLAVGSPGKPGYRQPHPPRCHASVCGMCHIGNGRGRGMGTWCCIVGGKRRTQMGGKLLSALVHTSVVGTRHGL